MEIPLHWDSGDKNSILETGSASYIKFLGKTVFHEYKPTQFTPFEDRLIDWLNNVEDDVDKQLLLRLLTDVFYVGRSEYEALYRSTFSSILVPWIIDSCDLNLLDSKIDNILLSKLNKSWICPISDSMKINSFLKVTSLKSFELRPDWKSLAVFGDINRIKDYLKSKCISRIILLEDFVGSGIQIRSTIKFAGENFPDVQFLICPLVICPNGQRNLKRLAKKYNNITFHPSLKIPDTEILNHKFDPKEPKHHTQVRELFKKIQPKFAADSLKAMYGFQGTGSQVVLHSNCPNNTLPIYHHENDHWSPLFPRVNRI